MKSLNLQLTNEVTERLERLRVQTESKDQVEVIRKGLALLEASMEGNVKVQVGDKGVAPPAQYDYRNCLNCFHNSDKKCLRSGYYCSVQRKYPSAACDKDFSGWTPIPIQPKKSLWRRLFGR